MERDGVLEVWMCIGGVTWYWKRSVLFGRDQSFERGYPIECGYLIERNHPIEHGCLVGRDEVLEDGGCLV
jgi:hypothetical protein